MYLYGMKVYIYMSVCSVNACVYGPLKLLGIFLFSLNFIC